MTIIDNTGLIYLESNKINYSEDCFITPEVREEFEVKALMNLSSNFIDATSKEDFDLKNYLESFKFFLNTYPHFSLSKQRGLGDVSLLALVKTLINNEQLSLGIDPIVVISDDRNLTIFLNTTFKDYNVTVITSTNFF